MKRRQVRRHTKGRRRRRRRRRRHRRPTIIYSNIQNFTINNKQVP